MSDHAWKNAFGADLNGSINLATDDAASGTGSVFGSITLGFGQDNDTVNISSSGGGTFGDISVDTGNDFNFFFAEQPTADGSGGLFSGLFSGLSSLFSFQDNDTVNISSSGGGTFGDISVDTGNDFNFFFGSSSLFPTEVA
jgi:PHP family Zn ribbon phosphoesterase